MKNLTTYFNESLLDDEDDIIVRNAGNAEAVGKIKQIVDWLDENTAARGWWNRFPEDEKNASYKISPNQLHMADKYDELLFDIKSNVKEFPEYLNVDNGCLDFNINTKKFTINASLTNINMISIKSNVEVLLFKKPVTGILCQLECPNLNILTMTKDSGFSNSLDLSNCPKLNLLKCKFPTGKHQGSYKFTRNQINQLYNLIGIDPVKIKVQY